MKQQLAMVCLLIGVSGLAQAIEIIYPDSPVGTVATHVSLVGRTGAGTIAMTINGKQACERRVVDGVFHARLPLPYGLNRISIHAVGSDSLREAPVEVQVLCGPRIPRNYEKMFAPTLFHGSEPRRACRQCHDADSTRSGDANHDAWCYSCHIDIRRQFSSHGVASEQLCTMCHDIKADMTRSTGQSYSDMNPCFKCHTDKIGEFAQDYIHGPVAGGTCTVCHNPHGSEFENNLKTPQPVLCLFCHTDVVDMDAPQKHEPFAKGRCTACHDPHATANRWVLVKKTGELCLGCHADDVTPARHRHPTGGRKPKLELAFGLNLDDDGNLECLTCHRPHGSIADNLLRSQTENGCHECHPEY